MKVLGIDPGITTGYSLVEDGELKASGNILVDDLDDSILVNYAQWGDLAVVIEETPSPTMSQLDKELKQIVGWLYQKFPSAVWISPGVWKQNRSIINLAVPYLPDCLDEKPTPHQRDSYRLAMFFLIIWLPLHPQEVL